MVVWELSMRRGISVFNCDAIQITLAAPVFV